MIRKAFLKDSKEIYNLLKEIYELHKTLYPEFFSSDNDSKYNLKEVEELIKDNKYLIKVYINEENKLVGYLIGYYIEDYFYIDDLCVNKNYQHQKIGSKLIESLKEENIINLRLNVYYLNKNAIKFYEKLGFKILKQTMYLELK